MDMFEDERERASLHRRGTIARGVAKRGLVAFLAFAMAFGATPAQLWAEGAEGIAEAGSENKASTALVPDQYGYRTNSWTPNKKYIPIAQAELDSDPALVQNNY